MKIDTQSILHLLLSVKPRITKMGGSCCGEDLFQAVCLRVLSGNIPKRPSKHWLLTVARNCMIDEWRVAKRERRHISLLATMTKSFDDEPHVILERQETLDSLQSELNKLNQKQRDVLVFQFQKCMSDQEAADHFQVPKETLRTRKKQAKSR